MARRARAIAFALTATAYASITAAQTSSPYWDGYGRNAQHTATADVAAQPLTRIRWQTPVDRRPQYSGTSLLIHYGSPIVTQANTVIVPVKIGVERPFRVEGRRGSDGYRLWRQRSNYKSPPHSWTPSFSPVLSSTGKLWIPGGGGTVYVRTQLDVSGGARRQRVVFFGDANYRGHAHAYQTNVFINTPITADAAGNVFFGFVVTGATPLGLQSGIARISDSGVGTWVSAASAAADISIAKVANNAAAAVSNDGQRLYVAVNNGDGTGSGTGYLLALDSTTLATVASVQLHDPATGQLSDINDNATSSPTVGPDGDVYFGTLENPFASHHVRGWLLHFDGSLAPKGKPGSFGWDDTVSIVPSSMVPSYGGSSAYLLMTKYNHYAGLGGDGVNRIAVLDPNAQMTDPISGTLVMGEVMTAVGPTPDADELPSFPNAVREWCINSAAIDPVGKSIFANSEDGLLYRWDTTTGTLAESIVLTAGIGEAYTPTAIGPDGTVYAINNATLFAVGQ